MGKGGICDADACRGPMPVFQSRSEAIWRGTFTRVCGERLNRFVTQAAHEVRFYIGQPTWRKERIEHALHLDIAEDAKHISDGFAKTAQRLQYLFSLREIAVVTTHNCKYRPGVGECHGSTLDDQFVRDLVRPIAEEMQGLLCVSCAVEDRSS